MKVKKKKLTKAQKFQRSKEIHTLATAMLITFGVGFLLVSLTTYWIGFHNQDRGHNLALINEKYDLDLIDISASFESQTATYWFITGDNQQKAGYYLGILAGIFLGSGMFSLAIFPNIRQK